MRAGLLPHLGRTLRERRRAAGLTQLDIATRAGVSHATVSRLETGKAWPLNPDQVLAGYATELGVDAAELWRAGVDAWLQ